MTELLVAMLIAIVSTIVIFQTFSVAEGYRRTTTSGGDAQSAGALALFTLERDVRQAGYGLNLPPYWGCRIRYYDELKGASSEDVPPLPQLILAPLVITQGSGNAPDSISVMYGNSEITPTPAKFIQNMPSASADYKVDNRFGFTEGALVLAVESGKDCTLAQVSNLPGTPGQSNNVVHGSGTYTAPTGGQVPTRFNKPAGLGVSYTTEGRLYNLGEFPQSRTYSVNSDRLMLQEMLMSSVTTATPIFDAVVQLQAEYGKDKAGADSVIDAWETSTPGNSTEWSQVLAVRMVIVTRAGQYEKDEVTPATLPDWPSWAPAWTLTSDQRHYRYKVFQITVPLRNVIWTPS